MVPLQRRMFDERCWELTMVYCFPMRGKKYSKVCEHVEMGERLSVLSYPIWL